MRRVPAWLPAALGAVVMAAAGSLALRWHSGAAGEAALAPPAAPAVPARERREASGEAPVVFRAGFAMGSFVRITAAGPGADRAAAAALQELDRLDSLLDRFYPGSAVAAVNAQAGRARVPVPQEVAQLVELALKIAERTGGAFDPTVGPLVDAWGFGSEFERRRPARPPEQAAIERARRLVNYRDVKVERRDGEAWVGLARPGMVLDLGAIAQGYGAERAAAVLRAHGVKSALVDVGGEIVAIGTRPSGPQGANRTAGSGPWRVGVRHPRFQDRLVATVLLEDRAAATSGDYERCFEYQGSRFGHVIHPFTGWPARGLVSVTVIHRSATVADALATAVMVLGPEKGETIIRSWPGAEAILVDEHLNVRQVKGP
ncbi:MAG: FAD:protein FMN transferase [Bacillota bacterium]